MSDPASAPDAAGELLHLQRIRLARIVLVVFLLTFIAARLSVILIMSRTIPDLYLHLGGTHIHHLNHGIFLLAGAGAFLLFGAPRERIQLNLAAVAYGAGLALTFDEFGMWIHLGGGYWQRASVDAIVVIGALLALAAYAPKLSRFRRRHWSMSAILAVAVLLFFFMLNSSFRHAGRIIGPKLDQMESTSPE